MLPSSPPYDNISEHCDARGLLIPDDIVRYSGLLKSDPETFWSSNQFYVKRDPYQFSQDESDGPSSMQELLSAIPDHHFCLIKSLCLDFGWADTPGFLCACPTDESWFTNDKFELLMQSVLRRGNQNLVVKILWTTTMSIPVQRMSRWNAKERKWGYESSDRPFFDERPTDRLMGFKKRLRSLGYHNLRSLGGYDENRVRLITRVIWKDELPNFIWPEGIEGKEYEECEDRIYEIDPISKDYVWNELWQSVRISFGLMWNPDQGHFEAAKRLMPTSIDEAMTPPESPAELLNQL